MRIAITGASGLIGTAVTAYFQARGHAITRVSRQRGRLNLDPASFEGQDVVIHLAGANIPAGTGAGGTRSFFIPAVLKRPPGYARFWRI